MAEPKTVCAGCPLTPIQLDALKRLADRELAYELLRARWGSRIKLWGVILTGVVAGTYFMREFFKDILLRIANGIG